MAGEAPVDSLEALTAHWRGEADVLRRCGAETLADLTERHASEVEAVQRARRFDAVTLEEASEIGGYSYDHLQRLVADGKIPNAGRKGSPRIHRQDVPRKPGHGTKPPGRTKLEMFEEAVQRAREEANE